MLKAGFGHLRKAFLRQRQPTLEQEHCRMLLLFYAVECGLKAAWLARNRLPDTSEIEPLLRQQGHDLMYWVAELRLPATITHGTTSFRTKSGQNKYDVAYAHQAWRSGTDMNPWDEQGLSASLTRRQGTL
jgi:hypothetical protein